MNNFKKTLLIGTALVAVGGFAAGARAADEIYVDADDSATFDTDELATAPFDWGAVTDGTGAAGEATDSHDIQVQATGTIQLIDADVIGDGDDTNAAITAGVDAQILTLEDTGGDDSTLETVTVDGDISIGDVDSLDLAILGEADAGEAFTVDVNGDVDLGTGALTVDVGAAGDEDVTLDVSGDITAASTTLNDDAAGGQAVLELSGATVQTVAGTIDGDVAGEGVINITGAGATFTGEIGGTLDIDQITLSNDGTGSSVIFEAGVGVDNASGIVIGDGGGSADTYTVTFDTTDAGFTVDGTVQGAATDTSAVVISGGNTLVQSDAWGGVTALDSITISGTGTTLDSGAAIEATAITIGSGAELEMNAAVTGDIDGASAGVGTLNVDTGATLTGSIGDTYALSSITVAEGEVLTVTGAAGDRTIDATTLLLEDATDDGTEAGLTLTPGANTITVGADITTGFDSEGAIIISDGTGTVAFEGDIGTSTKAIATLTVGAGSNNVVTTEGNLYVDAIVIDDSDELHFLGDGVSQVVSGTIDGAGAANDGAIIVGDGTVEASVTFNGAIGTTIIDTFDVLAESTAILAADATTTTDFTVSGTLRVNEAVSATSAAIDGTDGTVEVVVGTDSSGDDNSGTLVLTAADWEDLDGTNSVTTVSLVIGSGYIQDGEEFVIVDSGTLTNGPADATIESDSALFDFTVTTGDNASIVTSDANEVIAVADVNDVDDVMETTNGANVVEALLDITNTQYDDDDDLASVYDALVDASSSEIDEVAEALAPTVDAGNLVAATTVNTQSANITNTRLASLRDGGPVTGMAAGNTGEGIGVWAQVFGQTGEQDARDGIDGYDVDTLGFSAGIDTKNMSDDLTIGLAFSYSNTDIESDNANTTDTDIDTYQVTLYGEYELDDRTWLTGQVAYAAGQNDTTRHNVGGVAGLNANGDFDSDMWSLRAELGRDYETDGGMVLSPSVLANYMYYDPDGYTETGAGGAGLVVDQDELSIFEMGIGVDASWLFEQADGAYLEPEISVAYRYDFVGDEYAATSRFVGGTTSFQTEGFDPAQNTFNIGAGLTYYTIDNWEFKANYDYEVKEDYDAHSGLLRAAYKF